MPRPLSSPHNPTPTEKEKACFCKAVFPVPGPQLCSCIRVRRDTPSTRSFGPRLEYQIAWCLLKPLLCMWDYFPVAMVTKHSLLPISEANAFV